MGLWSSIRGDVFGGIASGVIGSIAGRSNARYSADLQLQNWIYQQQNAHQYEVDDLRAAGLNPILSATNSQIAGMGAAPSVVDNGVGANITNALMSAFNRQANLDIEKTKAEIARTEAETNQTNAKTNQITNGIYGNDITSAKDRYFAETNAINADISLKNSAKDVNKAQAGYIIEQKDSLHRLTDVQVKQINQDIINSTAIAKATVEKYGADAEASRSVANQALTQCKFILEQIIGQQLDNQQARRILENPKAELDAETWDSVHRSPFWSSLYNTGQFFKELNPFSSASVGYHKSNQNRTSTSVRTSTADYNYNRNNSKK